MHVYLGTHIFSLYFRTAIWMFIKLGRDEILITCTSVWAFYQIRPAADPGQDKNESKRASKKVFLIGRLHLECGLSFFVSPAKHSGT